MRKSFKLVTILMISVFSQQGFAQEFTLGGHAGALGTTSTGSRSSASTIAFGPFIKIDPYGWAAFKLDATFARLEDSSYFSSSPAIQLNFVNYEEFQLGVLAGPGFYKIPDQDLKFALNMGVAGDFALAKNLSIGMEARYHPIFDSVDVWTVYLTMGFRFQGGDGW